MNKEKEKWQKLYHCAKCFYRLSVDSQVYMKNMSMDENGNLSEILVMPCQECLAIFSLWSLNIQTLNALLAGM